MKEVEIYFTFFRTGRLDSTSEVVLDTVTKAIELVEIPRRRNRRILATIVTDDLICSRRNFEVQRVINKIGEIIEREL